MTNSSNKYRRNSHALKRRNRSKETNYVEERNEKRIEQEIADTIKRVMEDQ